MFHILSKTKMRNLIILFLLSITSCEKKDDNMESDKNIEVSNFIKIDYSVRDNYQDSLAKQINPNKNFQYWQYVAYSKSHSPVSYSILKEGGDTLLRKKINKKISPNYNFGIFQGGHVSFRCNYVVTIENDKVNYIKTEAAFRDFLGTIDNLEEAMLLAITYGYELDDDIRGGEYRIVEDGFELHLMKYHDWPIRRESIEITINKDGFIKTKSLGIYCEGEKCL
jgi:hypothetical protein